MFLGVAVRISQFKVLILIRNQNKRSHHESDIHPGYGLIKATCSCGNVIETKSTLGKDIVIEVCSACHPFYTGKQKILDSGGRVDRFKKRFGSRKL